MVLVVDQWSIPRQLKIKLCFCKGVVDFTYDPTAQQARCKNCQGFAPHIARLCKGCGEVFLLSFTHPDECSMQPLCWDCLSDPLCADVINSHQPCGIDHSGKPIQPPRFVTKVPKVEWDGVTSFFSFGEETPSVDST